VQVASTETGGDRRELHAIGPVDVRPSLEDTGPDAQAELLTGRPVEDRHPDLAG